MLRTATVSGIVAPRKFTPQGNFLAGGKARRIAEIDRCYDDSTVIWQRDVYKFARDLADRLQPARVVDIGTGTGIKLHWNFVGHAAAMLQTDWRDQRTGLPNGMPQPEFLSINLEDFHELEVFERALDASEPTLFILSDVIEHLQDPRPVLRTLRRLLRLNSENRLVISTPDRHRVDGSRAEGLPDNLGHVRQWTLNEFGLAMISAGFLLHQIGRLPQNPFDPHDRTICCEVSCTTRFYNSWLSHHSLPLPAEHLVLTTEHAKLDRTGGIGTYIQLAEEADGQSRLILFAGAMGLPEVEWSDAVRSRGWIHVADMCGRAGRPLHEVSATDPDEILQAVLQALFFYDTVKLIEYQDYLGIGYRVAQAKRAGLLPPSVTVLAYAHGNHLYLDAASGSVERDRNLKCDAQERLSLELADIACFPSRYIRELYVQKGGFRPRSERHLPYPISLAPNGLDDLSRGPITNLVFYGKQTSQKGYHDFVEAVIALFSNPLHVEIARRVQRVVLMGVTDPDPRLAAIPARVEHGVWNRAEAVAMLRRFAADSLLVLPYRGDNHPLSVFEVVDCDCQLLAFDIGGVPELLPAELKGLLLCAPNAAALATSMARAVALSHWERCRLVERTRELVRDSYLRHTEHYKDILAELKSDRSPPTRSLELGAVTVAVPNLNGSRAMLEDVAFGLRNSLHPPAKVLLVDDGSTHAGQSTLTQSVASFGSLPTETVWHPHNRGLSAARNTGLSQAQTPYFCAHDNDNVVGNRFLQIACRILDANPQVGAVTCWIRYFEDGSPWHQENWGGGYRPIGADFGHALRLNSLGDALGVYRVSALREIGGWDETSAAKWEDWECYLRLLLAGHDVWVIPQEQMLYRVRNDSMLRTYPDFPGWLRLANALPGIPKAQAVALLRAIWTPSIPQGLELIPAHQIIHRLQSDHSRQLQEAQAEYSHKMARLEQETQAEYSHKMARLEQELVRLQMIEASTTWRATYRIRRLLVSRPTLRRALRRILGAAWRSARASRKVLAAFLSPGRGEKKQD